MFLYYPIIIIITATTTTNIETKFRAYLAWLQRRTLKRRWQELVKHSNSRVINFMKFCTI